MMKGRKSITYLIRMLVLLGIFLTQASNANAQFDGSLGNLINRKFNNQNKPANQQPAVESNATNNTSERNSRSIQQATTVSDSISSSGLPPIFEAARQGDEVRFAELLKMNMSSINKTVNEVTSDADSKYRNYALLDFAAEKGCTNIIQQLLDIEVSVGGHEPNGTTPLTRAAANNHLDAVRMLLKAKARPNEGLVAACVNGHAEVLRTLIEAGADANMPSGESFLEKAAVKGYTEIIRIVLREWAKQDPSKSYQHLAGFSDAFRKAAANGNLDVVKIFIADGANVSDRDSTGTTVIQNAIENNQAEVVAYLKEVKKSQEAEKTEKQAAMTREESARKLEQVARGKKEEAERAAESEGLRKRLQHALEHPEDVFGLANSRYRSFSGKVYDCAEPIDFLNRKATVETLVILFVTRDIQPQSLKEWLKGRLEEENRKLAEHPWSKVRAVFSLEKDTKVQQVATDGLLVRLDDSLALLRNHPKQRTFVDGDSIGSPIFVMKGGPFQYTGLLGATRTIHSYDFGVVVTPSSGPVEKFPIPEASR